MKKRVQFKRVNDLVKEYVKEGITSYGSIVLPNGNPAVRMGIRFKLANLYVIFDTIEGFYYFGKRVEAFNNKDSEYLLASTVNNEKCFGTYKFEDGEFILA